MSAAVVALGVAAACFCSCGDEHVNRAIVRADSVSDTKQSAEA